MDLIQLPVDEATRVGEARRRAVEVARRLGFDEETAGRVALVVSEAASNVLKHGGGGELLVGPGRGGFPGLEVLALDRGPGIASLAGALRDGYSTSGTMGTGLGAIARLSQRFEVVSRPGAGTLLLARLWPPAASAPAGALECGGVSVPKPGEDVAGDAWDVLLSEGSGRLLVADGLGHGPDARAAADAALRVFRSRPADPLPRVLEAAHDALRATRGAAVGLAEVDAAAGLVRFAGVGNVAAAVLTPPRQRNMVSLNGTVGAGTVKIREFSASWSPGALLILTSDGLASRWSLDERTDWAARDPSLVAAALYRDYSRGRDDATAVVLRQRSRGKR